MKDNRLYHNIYFTVLIMLLLVMLISSHVNYIKLLDTNETLQDELEYQRVRYESILNECNEDYQSLYTQYQQVVEENEKLKVNTSKAVVLPTNTYTDKEVLLLAKCVEAEAGKNNAQSQRYITQVILNRVHSDKFPNTISDVIYQKVKGVPQFSVAWNGMMNREVEPETLSNVKDVLDNGTDLPKYVFYFYSDSVTGNWVNTLNIHDSVEGTVFAYLSKEDF